MILEINGKTVIGECFAYEGCHKIYICENQEDIEKAKKIGYNILDISEIEDVYNKSCELKFIRNWALTKLYVSQFENAEFNWVEEQKK